MRTELSPRPVPDEIIELAGLPWTLTGKKLEVPIKRIMQGRAAKDVAGLGTVDRPELLTWFEEFAERRGLPAP